MNTNLKMILECGEECGLTTVGEAMLFAELHWDCFFSYENIDQELRALHSELNSISKNWDHLLIKDTLKFLDSPEVLKYKFLL